MSERSASAAQSLLGLHASASAGLLAPPPMLVTSAAAAATSASPLLSEQQQQQQQEQELRDSDSKADAPESETHQALKRLIETMEQLEVACGGDYTFIGDKSTSW